MRPANPEINLSVTFRHTDPTEALKKYAAEKLTASLKKFVHYDAEVQVVLSVEKRDHIADVKVLSKGFDVSGSAVTSDLYSAIDKVVNTIETRLRKQKERTVDHKHQVAPQ